MTAFTKENILKDGIYLYYGENGFNTPWADRKFIARFKYGGGSGSFATFLRKNFTVEEYFARYDNREGPLSILESKGYIQPHVKKWLKRDGFPVTPEGKKAWLAQQVERIAA